MLNAVQFVTNIDRMLFDGEMTVDSANTLVAGVKGRDLEILSVVIRLFDKYAVFDLHGNGKDAHIPCSDKLRADLEKFKLFLDGRETNDSQDV
jgi:hypothetical protein